jgi:hypothetical protein
MAFQLANNLYQVTQLWQINLYQVELSTFAAN